MILTGPTAVFFSSPIRPEARLFDNSSSSTSTFQKGKVNNRPAADWLDFLLRSLLQRRKICFLWHASTFRHERERNILTILLNIQFCFGETIENQFETGLKKSGFWIVEFNQKHIWTYVFKQSRSWLPWLFFYNFEVILLRMQFKSNQYLLRIFIAYW